MSRPLRLGPGRTLLGAAVGLALIAVTGYGSEGCRTPTQVTIELRTVGVLPCTSLKGVSIVVAGNPRDAEERSKAESLSAFVPRGECNADGRTIGTLVVTPSSGTGAILVRARISDAADATCVSPDYKGCIVARRSFAFIDHASVTLPMSLEAACVDVPCNVESSCRSGVCVTSETVCSDSTSTCDSPAEPVIGVDGGAVLPDGSSPVDGSTADISVADSSTDALLDALPDAPYDPDAAAFGNACPTMGGPVDCNADAKVCCYMGSYFCQTTCTTGYFAFNCLGRKYCNSGGYCCGLPNTGAGTKGSSCDTTNGQMCSQNGSHYLCTSDADCPPSLSKCTGVYYDVGMGVTRECRAN